MWMSLGSTPENVAPSSRTKHSATLLGSDVYLFGGRNGNLPLKDLWRYNLSEGKWSQLEPSGDRPPCLQEHTAVAYKDCIYVFGGEVGFSAGTETPLWMYNTENNSWRKIRGKKGVLSPKGRRGHTALIYKGFMIVYGGYQDLRGSSNELWSYHFETESWHLLSPKSLSDTLQRPSGRHKHSAVLHDGAMWIYGGMTDLQERGDLWRWDIASKLWYSIKTKTNPGPLHSHAVCKLPSSMLVFGGESNGLLSNDLWRFHFGTEIWEKLQFPGSKPHPRAESIALTVSDILFNVDSHLNAIASQSCTNVPNDRNNSSAHRNQPKNGNRNNKIGPVDRKYMFSEGANLVSSAIQNNNLNFLKEISKLSSINLSRFNSKCSYSVLNSSHDSTESLLKGKEGSDTEQTPTRMVKSQSANVIAGTCEKKKLFSNLTPAAEKVPYSIVEGQESGSSELGHLTRDPVSVPNFNDFKSVDSATVPESNGVPPEATTDLNNAKPNNRTLASSNLSKNVRSLKDRDNNKINLPGTPFSNEAKVKNVDNYNFSKRCQSDSYTSHLVTLGGQDEPDVKLGNGIPKSASVVRFKKQIEIADDVTSDYCSIETVNKVSSSSNYSQSPGGDAQTKELINDYPELKFGRSTDSSKRKVAGKGPTYGFSNPHYMGPDVQTILKSKEGQKCAKTLNSPPDSVLEDTGKVQKPRPNNEAVEMSNMGQVTQPKSADVGLARTARSPPRYLPLRSNHPYNTTTVPIASEKKKKFRLNSAGRIPEKQEIYNRYLQKSLNEEFAAINVEPGVPLSVFLIGGKEHGQITVFKRPISLWKLRLSSNVY